MERSCEGAIELGLPAIAFTDHADFVKVHDDQYCVDIAGYLDSIDRCRAKYPGLRILSGVELGEPHWFPKQTADILAAGPLDVVLGSVHCIKVEGEVVDASQFRDRQGLDFVTATRPYLAEVLAMVEGDPPFETLAHLDYPKRYWPEGSATAYRATGFSAERGGGGDTRDRSLAASSRGSVSLLRRLRRLPAAACRTPPSARAQAPGRRGSMVASGFAATS